MKKVLLLMSLLVALLSTSISAQQERGVCGVTYEQGLLIKERMMKNRKETPNYVRSRGATIYVPVKIHLLALDDGTARATDDRALDMLCILNEEWESLDVQFYLKGDINYIDNTYLTNHEGFNNPNGNIGIWNTANGYKVGNALNVFVTNNVGGNNGIGVTLAYYTSIIDCVFVRKQSMLGKSVLPHEMGHFFSLSHPFFGWEPEPWDASMHGLQVGLYSPGGNFNEKVNDPNCNSDQVADGICDTPPDYLFGFHASMNGGCGSFNQGTMDPNGVVIDPMENNTMSYFENCTDYLFTEDQMNEVHSDLNKPYRNYVNPGITPSLEEINQVATLTSPINGEERPFNTVALSWEPVPGATHYLVEVDRFNTFDWNPIKKTVTTNASLYLDLTPNVTYYWRVRPFSDYRTCTSFTTPAEFTTNAIASKVETVEGVNFWNVRPNPANGSEAIFVDVEALNPMNATINIYGITGQLMSSAENRFTTGTNTVEVTTQNLTAGVYMVSIQTETGITTKRLVIR